MTSAILSKYRIPKERLVMLVTWSLIALPFAIYCYYVWRYSVNIPIGDDYQLVLDFVAQFLQSQTVFEKVSLLFAQHNEHRMLVVRLIIYLQYALLHSVDFRALNIIGNLGWIILVLVLVFYCYRILRLPALFLIPIPYILLSFIQDENMFWASSSLPFHLGCLLSLLCLIALAHEDIGWASLLFPLALFTSGEGLTVYLVGNLYLLLWKKWRSLAIFLISSSLFVALYFRGYISPPYHPNPVQSFENIGQTISFLLIFLGSSVRFVQLSLLLGFSLFMLLAALIIWMPEQKFLTLIAGFVITQAAIAAVARSGMGLE